MLSLRLHMRKSLLYILLGIICINTFSLKQVYKLPILIVHYGEHHEIDPSVDFIDFLGMHYWGTDLNDNDDERDNELPFKKIEQGAISQVMAVPTGHTFTLAVEPNFNTLFFGYQAPHFENVPTGAPFKPPRLV